MGPQAHEDDPGFIRIDPNSFQLTLDFHFRRKGGSFHQAMCQMEAIAVEDVTDNRQK